MVAELTRRARTRGRLLAWAVGWCLRRLRGLAGAREMPKFQLVVHLGLARTVLQTIGAELAAAGQLDSADDVFYLDLAEARRGIAGEDLRAVVRDRRIAYDSESRRRHIPQVLLSDGTEPERTLLDGVASGAGVLTGVPGSSGSVTAKARVILDPAGAQLAPGEILVAPSTDPGWTPLFLTA
ncbi:MAG TPA: phosphoenolpyruvate synthase, partial [Streptosporangiaceae bacterium]